MFDTTVLASATYTQTTYSAAYDTGDGMQLKGQWFSALITSVTGLPNVKLGIQTSPDLNNWYDNTWFDGWGGSDGALINSVGIANMLSQSRNRYYRFAIVFGGTEPAPSSSSSSSSNSSAGTGSITLQFGLVPSQLG